MSYFRHFSIAILSGFILFAACDNEKGSGSEDAVDEDSSENIPATITSKQLFTASLEGNLNFVKVAAEQDIDLDQQDEMGRTPLMLASYNGHSDVVQFLLENEADANATDSQGRRTPLAFAASGPFPETVEILLENGADPNQVDDEEWTPLMWAAAEGNEQVVRVLLDHGADPNLEDKDSDKASNFASDNGHSKVVELLKEAEKGN